MYTEEQKKKAVLLFIQYDLSPSTVIYELGYPSKNTIRNWYRQYQKTGRFEQRDRKSSSKYSSEQRKTAIEYYLAHGRSITKTIQALGYPGKSQLCEWLKEDVSEKERRRHCKRSGSSLRCTWEEKEEAVLAYCAGKQTPKQLAEQYSVTPYAIYRWRDQIFEGKQKCQMPKKKVRVESQQPTAADVDSLKRQIEELTKQAEQLHQEVYRLQLEKDVLEKAAEIIKKGQGISLDQLKNHEKAMVIDALRNKYLLKELLSVFHMAKSSYCYQKSILSLDKYSSIRKAVSQAFQDSSGRYGYRRLHAVMRNDGIRISEKVIRRLMKEESLTVAFVKKKKYNSYQGEISPEVPNLLERDFHADQPNRKWLTDITEFHIPAGKVYLSPIIDCFDGLPVSWTIGTSPDADLVNSMLDTAIGCLNEDDHPIIHSDRGAHYRWPGWIIRMDKASLIRSMSKKGCSPDNSACEGFFGRLKNEMFYNRSWVGYSIDRFIEELDAYIHWYAEKRIKISLGGLSPIQYRQKLGLIV